MLIGIDASRAFQKNRTGIEEYSYQVIRHLMDKLEGHQVILYTRSGQSSGADSPLPNNWKVRVIKFPYLWTQVGLSLELLFHPVNALFIPAHIVPIIHPANTIVAIHGLEYEFCPKAYSFWERLYMRWSIKKSCRWAKKIIAVSENTKRDLINLYKVPGDKIKVVYEGVDDCHSGLDQESSKLEILKPSLPAGRQVQDDKYLLFIGRLEERKNICGIIDAYKILKERYNISHSLVLAGSPGHNYKFIKLKIKDYLQNYKIKNSKIIELGYVDEALKWQLLSNADVFLFPTFYEGFGLPILEAQSVGVPVVASDNSSIPEVTNYEISTKYESTKNVFKSAILVNPKKPEEIAEAAYKLISDKAVRDDIIKKGYENVKRFSWEKCSREIANWLIDKN